MHGSWADASGWNEITESLQRDGYPVIAAANPLRSLSGDSAYLAARLKTIKGPIVLVGHSYGGSVITNAATGSPNVKSLVCLAAYQPDTGESAATGHEVPGQPAERRPRRSRPHRAGRRAHPRPGQPERRRRPLHQAGQVPGSVPQQPPGREHRRRTRRRAAARHTLRLLRALEGPRVEDHPLVGPGCHTGLRHRNRQRAVHGEAGRIAHDRGRRPARGVSHEPRRRHRPHPAGRRLGLGERQTQPRQDRLFRADRCHGRSLRGGRRRRCRDGRAREKGSGGQLNLLRPDRWSLRPQGRSSVQSAARDHRSPESSRMEPAGPAADRTVSQSMPPTGRRLGRCGGPSRSRPPCQPRALFAPRSAR
ncbi:esterase/lipase family protein [Streptomyces camponoticapitis]|uniref:esterase/lipase family protein n=1 Tax=Streptomyces camponoticapitis TaxID=1616125 RepID=UPI0035716912